MTSRVRVGAGGRLLVTALVLGLLALGCGPDDRPVAVRGKVTFRGRPVAEGKVQFNDAKTGRGAEAELGPDGSYAAALPAGTYAVVILPPMIAGESQHGPPDPRFKVVPNIPGKYRSTATSGLTAAVSAEKATHDFDLNP